MIGTKINPGEFNEPFVVYAPQAFFDPETNELTGERGIENNVFGALDHKSGREITLEARETALNDNVLTIWYYPQISEKHEIKRIRTGKIFDILNVYHDTVGMLTHLLIRSRE